MATIGTLTVKLDALAGPMVTGFRVAQRAAERFNGSAVEMGARVGRVFTNLGRSAAGVASQFGTAGQLASTALDGLMGSIDGVGTAFGGLLTLNPAKFFSGIQGIVSSLTSTFTGLVSTIASGVIPQFEQISSTADFADKLGMSTQELSALHHAATLGGMSTGNLNLALQRMTRRLNEVARTGGGTAAKALETLGLNAEKLATMSRVDVLKEISDALETLPTQGDKIRAAFALFDSGGVDMVNVLKGGRQELEGLLREAEDLGLTFDNIGAERVNQANDAIDRLKAAFTGTFRQIAIGIAPLVETVATRLIPMVQKFGEELVFWIRAAIEDWDTFWQVLQGILGVVEARVKAIATQMMSLGFADTSGFERLEQANIDRILSATRLLQKLQRERDAAEATPAGDDGPKLTWTSRNHSSRMREEALRAEQFTLQQAIGPSLLDARSVEAFRAIARASQPMAKVPVEERQLEVLHQIRDELSPDPEDIDL